MRLWDQTLTSLRLLCYALVLMLLLMTDLGNYLEVAL
jgi:hypothetical protein